MDTSDPVDSAMRPDSIPTVSIPAASPVRPASGTDPEATTDSFVPLAGFPTHAGRCRLVEEVGRGGMGVVLRAVDPFFGRQLAVKVLLARADDRPDLARRFLDEARLTGRLQHPGIPPVHEQGTLDDGRPYFTMKLIEGNTLDALLKKRTGPLEDLPRFVTVFGQVCQTVAYAHSKGVIHRDLKPHNIMVGAFGEVQVMDWGLAKMLGADSGPEAAGQTSEPLVATEEERTQVGQALGTPAYMPPEQARGERDALDERADVFGLGAILCTLLTGRPPYDGPFAAAFDRARRGDLEDAWRRLDGCGADAELVRLARSCLAPRTEDRLRDAAAVAEAVTAYQAGVAERLKAAEIDRAAAQARARAERGKRRLTVALTGLVLVAVATSVGVWAWLKQQQHARQQQTVQQANQALGKAQLLREQAAAVVLTDLDHWREAESLRHDALAAAEQAEQAVSAGEPDAQTRSAVEELLPQLREEVAETTWDRAMVERLTRTLSRDEESATDDDFDRHTALHPNDDGWVMVQAYDATYARAFREYGIDLETLSAEQAAEAIGRSRIRAELIQALEGWLTRLEPGAQRDKFLRIATAADPDPIRDRLRHALARQDLAELERLAGSEDAPRMPASSVLLLADALFRGKRVVPAIDLLLRAQRLNPGQASLNSTLGRYLMYSGAAEAPQMQEAVRFYTAAEAANPGTGGNRAVIADALAFLGAYQEAEAKYRQAIQEQPNLAWIRGKLAATLAANGRYTEALEETRRAVELRPQSAFVYESRGGVCLVVGRYEDAVAAYRKAISIRPEVGVYHSGLGRALAEVGHTREAIEAHHEAIRLKPSAQTYANLANTLVTSGRVQEGIEAARTALRLQPGSSVARSALANALAAAGRHAEAVEIYREAITATPHDSGLWWRLAVVFRKQGKQEEARATLREAIRRGPQQGPRLATMYNELGLTCSDLGEPEQGLAAFRKAVETNPDDAVIRENLGDALRNQGLLKEAVEVFREAVRLKPEWSDPRKKLAEVLEQQGRIDEAAAILAEAGPDNAEAFYRRVQLYQDHGRHREALELLEPWLKTRPDDGAARYRLGVSLEKTDRLDEALAAYEKALTGPGTLRLNFAQAGLDFGAALLEQGRRLEKQGKADEARLATARGHAYRAWGLNRQGRKPAAAEEIVAALRLKPGEPKYYRVLADCLKETQPEEALGAWCAVLAFEPANLDAYHKTAELLEELERPDEALAAYEILLDRDPADERMHRGVGRLLMHGGRLREAADHFRQGRDEDGLKRCDRLMKLEAALASYLDGTRRPGDEDLLDLAELCRGKGRLGDAVRFYAEAERLRGLKPGMKEIHHAALAAALAAGEDRSESDRKAHREQALRWLRGELTGMMKSLTTEGAGVALGVQAALTRWQREKALAGLRDPLSLAELPEQERGQWKAFWAEVEALRQLARSMAL